MWFSYEQSLELKRHEVTITNTIIGRVIILTRRHTTELSSKQGGPSTLSWDGGLSVTSSILTEGLGVGWGPLQGDTLSIQLDKSSPPKPPHSCSAPFMERGEEVEAEKKLGIRLVWTVC